MQTVITGKAYVLGDNIDTDQIIPAKYLSFNPSIPEERKFFGMYALQRRARGARRGLPKGHVPFHARDEFNSDLHDRRRRQELRLRLSRASTPRSRWPRPASSASSPSSTPASSSATASTAATSSRSNPTERLVEQDPHRRRAGDPPG